MINSAHDPRWARFRGGLAACIRAASGIKVPDDLFKSAEIGTFLDFRPEYTYTDTAGTVPAGAGDFIANAGDRSPNGADAVQATSAARWQLLQTGGGVYYASTDETDDVLPVTLPAITGGTVVLVGLSGIYYEESWDYAGGTLNIGPTTVPGLPAGILSVVGGLCAVLITDRALTAAEKAAVSAWGKARGAAGVFELGPELVTNGTFDTDTTGWAPVSATLSVSDGNMVVTNTAAFGRAIQGVDSEPGENYLLGIDFINSAGANGVYRLGTTSNGEDVSSNTVLTSTQSVNKMINALSAETFITVSTNRADVSYETQWDNISIRKLELVP